jgi:hypothetical protein
MDLISLIQVQRVQTQVLDKVVHLLILVWPEKFKLDLIQLAAEPPGLVLQIVADPPVVTVMLSLVDLSKIPATGELALVYRPLVEFCTTILMLGSFLL